MSKPFLILLSSIGFALLLGGCANQSLFQSNAPGHDPQACVESALRRKPDEVLARQARGEFELACRVGDAASCSALGVMYEVGLAAPHSPDTAKALYARACRAGNDRGCNNLGTLRSLTR